MIKNILNSLLDCIYKHKCVVCGCSKTNEILCKTCLNSVEKLSPFAQRKIQGVDIYSAVKYRGTVQNLIRNFKFHKRKNAAIPCAAILYEYFCKVLEAQSLNLNRNNSVLVCVPSHPLRVFNRGYCHTELILKEFSKLTGIDCNLNIIKKVKNTCPQYKVRANKKLKNVSGAFRVDGKNYKGQKVILIDDITTTGATLEEIIKTLKANNIEEIICFTLAC